MGQVMYLDAFAGAAGDMILGALLDAGLPEGELRDALGSLGVDHELIVERVQRAGLGAVHVRVAGAGAAGGHGHEPQGHDHHSDGHDHQHPHQHPPHAHDHGAYGPGHTHRTLATIEADIARSSLSSTAKGRATAMFRRIAEAEAAIHGTTLDRVHLHEVGALDSVIDIVGCAFAFEWWGIDDVVASPLNVGAGAVRMAHGTYPVPAPATVRLLGEAPVYSRGPEAELLTPTGALVVTTYARGFGPLPRMRVEHTGYGAGSRDFEAFPNVLRVFIGRRETPARGDRVVEISCEIDDMAPQLFGPLVDRLLDAGALDAFLTPVQMKKGRPGTLVTVLAPPALREAVCAMLFRETTTLGARFGEVDREVLDRRWVDVTVGGHTVRIKVAERGGELLNALPEFDDCVRVADATGRPVRDVQAEALRAWWNRG